MMPLSDARLRRPRGVGTAFGTPTASFGVDTATLTGTPGARPFGGGNPGTPGAPIATSIAPVNTDGAGGGGVPEGIPAGGPRPVAPGGWRPPAPSDSRGGNPYGASPYGYAATSPYGPGSDLRGTQIAPTDSAQTQAATGAVTHALGAYTGFQAAPWQGVAAGSYAPGADTTALRGSLSQALAALQSAPDRGQLAAQNFALLDQTAQEASARDVRGLGAAAAKFGRIGSGLTTSNLGDLGERQALARTRAQSQMALDAAGQTMGDRLNVAGAIGSGFGALSGADLSTAGMQQGLRNEARGERDARSAYDAADFGRRGQLFGDTAAYASGREATDAARRGELRGERAYQTGAEQTAYDRNRTATLDAQNAQDAVLRRALALMGAGGAVDLSGAVGQAGQQASANGAQNMDAVYQLLAQYMAGRRAA